MLHALRLPTLRTLVGFPCGCTVTLDTFHVVTGCRSLRSCPFWFTRSFVRLRSRSLRLRHVICLLVCLRCGFYRSPFTFCAHTFTHVLHVYRFKFTGRYGLLHRLPRLNGYTVAVVYTGFCCLVCYVTHAAAFTTFSPFVVPTFVWRSVIYRILIWLRWFVTPFPLIYRLYVRYGCPVVPVFVLPLLIYTLRLCYRVLLRCVCSVPLRLRLFCVTRLRYVVPLHVRSGPRYVWLVTGLPFAFTAFVVYRTIWCVTHTRLCILRLNFTYARFTPVTHGFTGHGYFVFVGYVILLDYTRPDFAAHTLRLRLLRSFHLRWFCVCLHVYTFTLHGAFTLIAVYVYPFALVTRLFPISDYVLRCSTRVYVYFALRVVVTFAFVDWTFAGCVCVRCGLLILVWFTFCYVAVCRYVWCFTFVYARLFVTVTFVGYVCLFPRSVALRIAVHRTRLPHTLRSFRCAFVRPTFVCYAFTVYCCWLPLRSVAARWIRVLWFYAFVGFTFNSFRSRSMDYLQDSPFPRLHVCLVTFPAFVTRFPFDSLPFVWVRCRLRPVTLPQLPHVTPRLPFTPIPFRFATFTRCLPARILFTFRIGAWLHRFTRFALRWFTFAIYAFGYQGLRVYVLPFYGYFALPRILHTFPVTVPVLRLVLRLVTRVCSLRLPFPFVITFDSGYAVDSITRITVDWIVTRRSVSPVIRFTLIPGLRYVCYAFTAFRWLFTTARCCGWFQFDFPGLRSTAVHTVYAVATPTFYWLPRAFCVCALRLDYWFDCVWLRFARTRLRFAFCLIGFSVFRLFVYRRLFRFTFLRTRYRCYVVDFYPFVCARLRVVYVYVAVIAPRTRTLLPRFVTCRLVARWLPLRCVILVDFAFRSLRLDYVTAFWLRLFPFTLRCRVDYTFYRTTRILVVFVRWLPSPVYRLVTTFPLDTFTVTLIAVCVVRTTFTPVCVCTLRVGYAAYVLVWFWLRLFRLICALICVRWCPFTRFASWLDSTYVRFAFCTGLRFTAPRCSSVTLIVYRILLVRFRGSCYVRVGLRTAAHPERWFSTVHALAHSSSLFVRTDYALRCVCFTRCVCHVPFCVLLPVTFTGYFTVLIYSCTFVIHPDFRICGATLPRLVTPRLDTFVWFVPFSVTVLRLPLRAARVCALIYGLLPVTAPFVHVTIVLRFTFP